MPNHVIDPRTFAIIALATVGKEVSSLLIQIPPQLIIEAQKRAVNFGIQYGAMAISQTVAGSHNLDPYGPSKAFVEGYQAMANASTPQEAATRGTIAAAALFLSAVSSEDPNASLTFGGFLIVLMQNVLLIGGGGSQAVLFSNVLLKIYLAMGFLIRVVTEIRIEKKRKKLNLPRAKFRFNLFNREEKKDFIFKYPRIKKRKLKILSREISLPVIYQKERVFKHSPMVKPISIA